MIGELPIKPIVKFGLTLAGAAAAGLVKAGTEYYGVRYLEKKCGETETAKKIDEMENKFVNRIGAKLKANKVMG